MGSDVRRHGRRKRGQAVVELALLLPFFLLVIVGGVVEFGLVFYNYVTLQQIANNVCQYAAESTPAADQSGNYDTGKIDTIKAECRDRITQLRSKLALPGTGPNPTHLLAAPGEPGTEIAVAGGGTVKVWKLTLTYNSTVLTPLYSFAIGTVTSSEQAFIRLRTLATYPVK